ncbi:site-2 protease family protein [Patulibacter sp.]|uniref:site-2 protease family protein n=1 Tax=Patulibacter sp. TaxID=1912859 RepID=UPI0027192922|nr:site-2 protease family protein [Patulibacter sp.]MDO9409205.1 site-2 protease family protein [Patulibacter sp.]
MTTPRTVPLATLFGIRIGVNPSWFFALLLMIVLLGGRFDVILPDASPTVAYALAVAAALIFFVSLVAHELGHALAARRFGIETQGIELWLLGGVARLSRDSRSPKEEFVVAGAGPLVTLVLFFVGLGAGLLMGSFDELTDAVWVPSSADVEVSAGLAVVGWLTFVNGALFVFNIIPAFPLDGGRLARAVAWKITGNRQKATVAAGMLGRGFAILLGAFGVYELMQGDSIGGIWYLILAWFIAGAAKAAVLTSAISEQLHEVTATDIMDTQPPWLPQSATVLDAEHETLRPFDAPWAAVLDDDGYYRGIVQADRVRSELDAGRPGVLVAELVESEVPRIPPDAALDDLLQSEALRRLGALPVVDEQRVMLGLVTSKGVRDALAEALPGAEARA